VAHGDAVAPGAVDGLVVAFAPLVFVLGLVVAAELADRAVAALGAVPGELVEVLEGVVGVVPVEGGAEALVVFAVELALVPLEGLALGVGAAAWAGALVRHGTAGAGGGWPTGCGPPGVVGSAGALGDGVAEAHGAADVPGCLVGAGEVVVRADAAELDDG